MFNWIKKLFLKLTSVGGHPETREVAIHDMRETYRSPGNDISLLTKSDCTAQGVVWAKYLDVGEFILVELEGEEVMFGITEAKLIGESLYLVSLLRVENVKEEE